MTNLTPIFVAAALMCGVCAASSTPRFEPGNDLRDFYVGMPVSTMSAEGYKDRICAGDPSIKIAQWSDYARCPRDARGLYAVTFKYDNADNPLARVSDTGEGTAIAGQAVVLTLLIDDKSRLAGLVIVTDPGARLFARRRAHVFGQQVKARFGEDGWVCRNAPPGSNEEAIGPTFINEHCAKVTATRRFILDRKLYRYADRPLRDFVSETRLLILQPELKQDD